MRVKSIHLENFGSYKILDLEFGKGLTLVQGPNGAGKSTIFDAVSWILFGRTAKGGKADEIRSWFGGATTGRADLTNNLSIDRSRSPNDLIISDLQGETRGKDLSDTQRRIDERLGFGWDLYQRGAYYHEFSETAQFFSASAKYRRDLCESIVDFSLALKIQSNSAEKIKSIEDEIEDLLRNLYVKEQEYKTFQRLTEVESRKVDDWRKNHVSQIKSIEENEARFEKNRRRVISNQCRQCGTALSASKEVFDDSINPYTQRLEELRREVCPYDGTVRDYQAEIDIVERCVTSIRRRLDELTQEQSELGTLLAIVKDFRGLIVKNTIDYVTSKTNTLLQDYFDGELVLALEIEGSDKLNVTIQKDGNIASFTQLSKGQRQILKLCFSVAIMEAIENHHGVKFEQLYFDEALDGLSDTMKVKAFRLFEMLQQSHEDVFVIDHSEALKVLFPNTITISNDDGNSVINAST